MTDVERELARLEHLARLLDSRFSILGIRFGFDALLGLVPGVGDTAALAPSLWMIWRGHRMGLPRRHLIRMALNTGLDYGLGIVPLIGDVFDVAFKANLRNAAILRTHLQGLPQVTEALPRATGRDAGVRPYEG